MSTATLPDLLSTPFARTALCALALSAVVSVQPTEAQQLVLVKGAVVSRPSMKPGDRVRPGTLIHAGRDGVVVLAQSWLVNRGHDGSTTRCETWVIIGGPHSRVALQRYLVRDERREAAGDCHETAAHTRLPYFRPGLPFINRVTFRTYSSPRADLPAPVMLKRLRSMVDSIRATDSVGEMGPTVAEVPERNVRRDLSVSFSSRPEAQGPGYIVGSIRNRSGNVYQCVRLEFNLLTRNDAQPGERPRYSGVVSTEVKGIRPGARREYEERLPYTAGFGLRSVSECA